MQHLVGGISSAGRAVPMVDGEVFLVERASGPYLFDLSGRRYIDTALGFGATMLGHAHQGVNEAVARALNQGSMPAFAHPGEEAAAARLTGFCGPLDQAIFTNTGSEAVHMACRIARAVTGRPTIAKMGAGFDGWYDSMAVGNAGSAEALISGNSRAERHGTTLVRFNDIEDLERLFAERSDIAAIIAEPLLANAGCIEARNDYLHQAQALARRHGALFIADEVLMGFRQVAGLASQHAGLDPDLATVGKAIGNGFCVAAVLGRAEMMKAATDGRAVRAGTYSGNPVATAAVLATLDALENADYAALEARGNRLRNALVENLLAAGEMSATSGLGMVFTLWFAAEAPVSYSQASEMVRPELTLAFHAAMRRSGIMTMPQSFGRFYLSFAHDDAVVADMIERAATAIRDMV
ncbi:aspartate aminotransferase family protein [Jiella mangrovi]|uniref:Aminotransferase class III-fold pyridoxal phosphate-dependent enzyme n=1 Tax=Jiella mangrovi TaxID=2821407 RepID=A0ABS4BJD7_9HYPH|nr:aminotransferase class III-fold pyridoxal phosphate-dependent enzyme [Jiella mangrovi]MBP0616875.1 aminotransferase class III-fold pyridoxal phosphate-dependent enzyme [Jiella mangrovi]